MCRKTVIAISERTTDNILGSELDAIDILFKDEASPNVYVVDSITPDEYGKTLTDGTVTDNAWWKKKKSRATPNSGPLLRNGGFGRCVFFFPCYYSPFRLNRSIPFRSISRYSILLDIYRES